MVIAPSSLALLLVVTASSNSFSEASNLHQRSLSGTTIATNVATYKEYEDYASAMLEAVNEQRATTGLSHLCLNIKLHIAAQGHANYMAANDIMSHDGWNGTKSKDRISLAGYNWTSVAENVAACQPNVEEVMQSWIHSPKHLENIMGHYTMFGSAYAFNINSKKKHFWVQEFATSEENKEVCDKVNVP